MKSGLCVLSTDAIFTFNTHSKVNARMLSPIGEGTTWRTLTYARIGVPTIATGGGGSADDSDTVINGVDICVQKIT